MDTKEKIKMYSKVLAISIGICLLSWGLAHIAFGSDKTLEQLNSQLTVLETQEKELKVTEEAAKKALANAQQAVNEVVTAIEANGLAQDKIQEAKQKFINSIPVANAASIESILPTSQIVENIFVASPLRGLEGSLITACSKSKVPDTCAIVIALQTQYETGKGTTGSALEHKNLTGMRYCLKTGIVNGKPGCIKYEYYTYKSFRASLIASAELFIRGDYESYFTQHDFETGLKLYLNRWGTCQYDKISAEYKRFTDYSIWGRIKY